MDALAAAQVELRLGFDVQSLAANQIRFADGAVLDVDAVVLASGMIARPFGRRSPEKGIASDELSSMRLSRRQQHLKSLSQAMPRRPTPRMDTGRFSLASMQGSSAAWPVRMPRDLLGLPMVSYTQPRYVTCLDLGRSGAVFTRGWDRQVEKTGGEAKAVKRFINTKIIYPPADGTAEALLAGSTIDLAERARAIGS